MANLIRFGPDERYTRDYADLLWSCILGPPKDEPKQPFGDLSWVKITDEMREDYRRLLEKREPGDLAPWKKNPIRIH